MSKNRKVRGEIYFDQLLYWKLNCDSENTKNEPSKNEC